MAEELSADVVFFFGNLYAQLWWEDLKQFHINTASSVIEFDRMIDDALEGVSPQSNLE